MTGHGVDRRTFLTGGAAAVGGAAIALGARAGWDASRQETGAVAEPEAVVPFHGPRQAGVGTTPQAVIALVALDLVPGVDRSALVRLMRVWTDDIARLTQGRPGLADPEPELALVPARLTVTLGYGPGVFTAAGLEHQRPSWLAPLPPFGIDRLEPGWCDGDLVLQVCADDELTVAHAVRVLLSGARTFASVRWQQRGFRGPAAGTDGMAMRNLMGQLDGTRNPDPVADEDLVWHGSDAPAWLVGGTSMVVRRIAIGMETWAEVDRPGREFTIGRRLSDGAPLTADDPDAEPDLAAVDDLGLPVIDVSAHIRRARTDDPEQRFLRRPYNYDEPPAPGELTRSGQIFLTFQRDPLRQLVPVQRRLDEADLLNQWTTPIGSAVFAVPGGCAPGEYLGQRLLEA